MRPGFGARIALAIVTIVTFVAFVRPARAACSATIEVHVVDSKTGEAIAGATVMVGSSYVGATDDDGRVSVVSPCGQGIALRVERADYLPEEITSDVEQPSARIEIALTQGAGEVIVVEGRAPPLTDMRSSTVLTGAALERTRGRSFADALADVPGVAQLRSATGLGKPIVRGQYGRRLLTLVDGVRHRSQDWGIDHAPEIDPFIADKLTVVRGASGVRYGPDAIGGAILVDPPALRQTPGIEGEAHLIGLSNGAGGSTAARIQGAPRAIPELAWRTEASVRRLAASTTPDYALDNTGLFEWSAGATVGYRGRGEYTLSYVRYQARIGVCTCLRIDSADDFFAQLESRRPIGVDSYRRDLAIERPYQAVSHDLAIARARWSVPGGELSARYAFQYDHRREYDIVRDAIDGPQYNFRLLTNDAEVSFDHRPLKISEDAHLRGSVGATGLAQWNRYTGLTLIPDFTAWSVGAFAIERLIAPQYEVEVGARLDTLSRSASFLRRDFLSLVRSDQIARDACSDSEAEFVDCDSSYRTLSTSAGALYRFGDWSAKLDLSTASRAPNTDEQYLNGTSPTFPVLGLGKPDLGPETTYSASATVTHQSTHVAGELSAYANTIDDYIYFAPAIDANGDPIFDVLIRGTFPRFTTRAVDALFYGADGGVVVTPVTGLELGAQFSVVRARNRTDGGYLVFVPPDRARGSVTYRRSTLWGARNPYLSVAGTYVTRQRRFDVSADLSAPPPAYATLDAELGFESCVCEHALRFALQGTNLTNTRYRDYTSLLRYFADQPGWQLLFRMSFHFSSPKTS
ncbi:MAG: TonB-dependent receptor [Kofleriaceae bacterium]